MDGGLPQARVLNRGKRLRRLGKAPLVASIVVLALAAAIPGAAAAIAQRPGASISSAGSAYRTQVLADHPAAYWRLGEASGTVAADEVGGNAGTYNNEVSLGQPGALVGDQDPAVSFDGINDYVGVPTSSALNPTSAVTLEAWVRRGDWGSGIWQSVIGKPGTGQSMNESYALWFNPANELIAYFGDGTNFFTVRAPLDTNWHYVVATYDNAIAKLYVDGALYTQTASSIQLTPNALPLTMGRQNSGSTPFGGLVDEVAFYTTVLPADRIVWD